MQLSDVDIKKGLELGHITINNFDENRLQPASYDVLLGYEFMIFNNHKLECIDPKKPIHEFMEKVVLSSSDEYFVIQSGAIYFGCHQRLFWM